MEIRHLTPYRGTVDRHARERLLRQRGCVVWLTGLSGSGKSTVAHALLERLHQEERLAYVLDGDNMRSGLNADLGFSEADRRENIRRVGEVAALFADAGVITVTAFISPFRADRDRVRRIVGDDRFLEIFLDVPIEICEQRDPKGLYQKARAGVIPDFTGISSPYEPPLEPALTIRNIGSTVDDCVEAIRRELDRWGILGKP
jgi:adenylyl-sulfate kinase